VDLEAQFVPHLTKPESMVEIIQQGVKAEFFNSPVSQRMFQWSVEYFVDGKFEQAVTIELLREEFPEWFDRNEMPEEEYLLNYLVDKLRTRYRRNQTQAVIRRIGALSVEDPEAALVTGLNDLSRIQFDTSTLDRSEPYALHFDTRVSEYFDRVLSSSEEARSPRGHFFGWPQITEQMWGIKPSELAVVVGAPSVGKSWCMSQIALAAARDGVRVYYASLENSKEMTLQRLDALLTGVPWKAYERGQLDREQTAALKRGREVLEELELTDKLIVDSPRYMTERTVFETYSRARFHDSELLVGDQLSWVTPRASYQGNQSAQISEVVTDIADYTREFRMASVWAAQFNREGARAGRGKLHQIALSTTIEQIVDWAFALSAGVEERKAQMMLFEMIKARRSEPKSWLLNWRLSRETKLSVAREYREE
jgi:replicative DNA helicase